MLAAVQVWNEIGLPPVPVTFWAAEKNAAKRQLLIQRTSPHMRVDQVFGDVKDLVQPQCYDYLNQCWTDPKEADIYVCGTPCVDLSALNSKQIEFGPGCDGQSSSVIDDVMAVVEKRKPLAVILENVERILHKRKCQGGQPGHKMVFARMKSMGYIGAFAILDAARWLPQRRSRAWFVFLQPNCGDPGQVLDLARRCQPAVPPSLQDLPFMSKLGKAHSERQRKQHTKKDRKLKWPSQTLHFIETHGLKPAKLAACKHGLMLCQDFQTLNLREQHLLIARYTYLQQCEALDPFSTCIILDISQSVGRVPWAVGKTPCLTGSSKLWVSKPGTILPAEVCAAVQGVPEALDAGIPHNWMRNLLGNAFCGPVAQSVLLSTLAVMGCCDLMRCEPDDCDR
ncbi:unnamed protein product [Cladocopium goreaui]|uniref:DNA (Cytosine-5-)-methyltransferase n=1 Tax=Cladocopium goreaui TaxID=2562237 RepID=A0A9P1CA24_9DINO|nr:unnamed protein product [Cladocopium goreaui]